MADGPLRIIVVDSKIKREKYFQKIQKNLPYNESVLEWKLQHEFL